MQRGSRITITPQGRLELRAGKSPHAGPAAVLDDRELPLYGHERVFDLAVAGSRVVALYDGDDPQNLPYRGVATTTLALDGSQQVTVTAQIARVAVTDGAVFMASPGAVITDDDRNIAQRPIDLASTARRVAVLDERGVTFFDARGVREGSVRLFAPTAIAVDPIEPGWLVAVDGGVVHLDGPGGLPRLVAPVAEPVAKVRRDRDAVYVRVGATLQVIRGEHVQILGTLDDDPREWADFDAGPEGLVIHGRLSAPSGSPAR